MRTTAKILAGYQYHHYSYFFLLLQVWWLISVTVLFQEDFTLKTKVRQFTLGERPKKFTELLISKTFLETLSHYLVFRYQWAMGSIWLGKRHISLWGNNWWMQWLTVFDTVSQWIRHLWVCFWTRREGILWERNK